MAITLRPRSALTTVLVGAVLALATAVACGGGGAAPSTEDADTPAVVDRGPFGGLVRGEEAPEFVPSGDWFNAAPFTLAEQLDEGRVVLVDFWTYSCVNCQRTLPFLKDWHRKYADRGLTIVGVHTPEFRFEHDPKNVARAVREAGLPYAIFQDNDWETWRAFDNSVWPAKYLIGADGRIFYRHFGEGRYEETEEAIRAALEAAGHEVQDIAVGGVEAPALDGNVVTMTRELYFGYERNFRPGGAYAAQEEYYVNPDAVLDLVDPGPPRNANVWYAHGLWNNADQAMVHIRDTEEYEDYLAFEFTARSVNPVMSAREPVEVLVQLDGLALDPGQAGGDVDWDAMGRSIVRVDEPRMYHVVELPALGEHVLRLSVKDDWVSVYSVTFGAYVEGP